MPNWNPEQYEKFIMDRTQPAIDLAHRLDLENPLTVLDVGCGPGNSTRILKNRFPDAEVIGMDNSDEMLKKAAALNPDIKFIKFDISNDLSEFAGKFDIVFSNACIQWLPNHKKLISNLMALLKPNGILAVQIPMQREHPIHTIISEITDSPKWSGKLTKRESNNLTTTEYYDILSDISSSFDIWETTYCHHMPDHDSIIEWYKGTKLRPYLEQLSDTDAKEFIGDIYNELTVKYKLQKNGEIMFKFPRLFFIARK